MQPRNLLIILSDQHNPRVMGCAGHPLIKTRPASMESKATTGLPRARLFVWENTCSSASANT